MMDIIITLSCIFLAFYMCNGKIMHSTIVSSPSELVSDKITNNTGFDKLALRYGIHQTAECDNYEKAFICIQKCVDKGYDVAYSDKYCFCTCYVKKQKAKYTMEHRFDRTKWKLGTPKTTKPAWIQKLENNAQSQTAESLDIIKKLETQNKYDNADIYNASNPSDSEYINSDTNGTDSNSTNYKATNASGSLTLGDAPKLSKSQNASNPSGSENGEKGTNGTDNNLIENKATNSSGSLTDGGAKQNTSNETDIKNVDSTTEPTDIKNVDNTTDSTNIKNVDSTTELTDIKNVDNNTDSTNIKNVDSTTEPTDIKNVDNTTDSTNIKNADSTTEPTDIKNVDNTTDSTDSVNTIIDRSTTTAENN